MRENMTKTEARQIAKRARQYGYYKPSLNSWNGSYVNCPLCKTHVIISGPRTFEADKAMLAHLLSAYADERCPEVASVRKGSEQE